MWENERRKIIIRNVIVGLLLVGAVAGLFMGLRAVSRQIEAEDAYLSEQHNSQRQDLNDARQENLLSIQQVYEADLNAVAQYLPGIVCWGDSLTAGSSGNVSYPFTLQDYIDAYICDIYDLRYALENPESYTGLNRDDYKISIPVVNMGAGQEGCATILGRAGVTPYVTKSDFVIPAQAESVTISLVSADGRAVAPLTAGNVGINPVTIAGVEGTLARVTQNGKTVYQFTRLEEGEETPVDSGTEIIVSSKEEYRDYIHVIWIGAYGDYTSSTNLVNDVKALLKRQASNTDRYLVIGPCTVGGVWRNGTSVIMDTIDSAMLQAFGNHYINLRKYLIEDGLRDAGIKATTADAANISVGSVPDSFRSNASGVDLNAVAYKLIGKLVYERMELLGYFDEVRQELKLDEITRDLLKKDASYFKKILNTTS